MTKTEAGSSKQSQHQPHAGEWQNWSGYQKCWPTKTAQPRDEAELASLVVSSEQVRVVGAGHSFSAVVPTQDTLISLDSLSGIVSHDTGKLQATFWAGSRISKVGEMLLFLGQALQNQGDIDHQSLGGAVGTGTHGTGYQLGNFSSLVRGFRLVTASGEILDCSPTQNPEIFQAGGCSLGALGVMTQITLQNRPAYRLKEQIRVISIGEALQSIEALKTQHRHVEFFAFPFGDKAILKTLDEIDEPATPPKDKSFSEDVLLGLVSEIARKIPPLNPYLQRLVSTFVTPSTRVGDSFRIFPSPRKVRFNEMEYHIPAERGVECLSEVIEKIRRYKVNVFFPIEYRYVAGDEVWLSPFCGGPRASIAVHQFYKQDHRILFNLVEPILRRYGGRPHWGKLHSLGAKELSSLYDNWHEFQIVRRKLDPKGKFLNDHLKHLFGI